MKLFSFKLITIFYFLNKDISWANFDGTLKGFVALNDAPSLNDGTVEPGTIEANTMAGTDESV